VTTTPRVLIDGLAFPEGPRWHENRLWLSDMHAHQVIAVDSTGRSEVVVEVPGQPSGLGWTTDGRLLVVSMTDRRLLRLDSTGLTEVADLSHLASFHCNDMVVDGHGRAYVGNFGFDLIAQASFHPAELILVTPEGEAGVVARDMAFPNGAVITPDGQTLIVGESAGARLTAFDIRPDGWLVNRRVWAEVAPLVPDGICLDAENCVWVASPTTSEVARIREGGEIVDRIAVETHAYACMLGGPGRRTLFIATASTHEPKAARQTRTGRIEAVEVTVSGVGWP
jgi:sugar lactone lactonase YvrE